MPQIPFFPTKSAPEPHPPLSHPPLEDTTSTPSSFMEPQPEIPITDISEIYSAEAFLADLKALRPPTLRRRRPLQPPIIEEADEDSENEDEVSDPSMAYSGSGGGSSSPPSGSGSERSNQSSEKASSERSGDSEEAIQSFHTSLSISELHLDDFHSLPVRSPLGVADPRHSHAAVYPPTPVTPRGVYQDNEEFNEVNHSGPESWVFVPREGCCKHGFGEDCEIWCSQSCGCGGVGHGLLMPKIDVDGARSESEKEAERLRAASGPVERDPPRRRKKKWGASKWEERYLAGMVLWKHDDDETHSEEEDEVMGAVAGEEEGGGIRDAVAAVATTAVAAVAIAVLWNTLTEM